MRMFPIVKRATDVAVGGTVLALSLPIQLAAGVAIRATMGGPVLFRQQRPGKDGRVFTMVKFRTMLAPNQMRTSDAERLTRLGRFLRATSIDELPTLWNVVVGDMSLVGPRPLLVDYLPLYSPAQARRHEVRPGITGLAQVNGRNNCPWHERFELDVEYVDTQSLMLDLQIVINTIAKVLQRDGVSQTGQATMTPFTGNSPDPAP
ncbi:sugar transferase [Microlunatus sp. Y2014]|uniref:sugar transferase n=1 Tax=Microlunatus sp. Y2014 TaxID=3418488 RepID=UPI003DA7818B